MSNVRTFLVQVTISKPTIWNILFVTETNELANYLAMYSISKNVVIVNLSNRNVHEKNGSIAPLEGRTYFSQEMYVLKNQFKLVNDKC